VAGIRTPYRSHGTWEPSKHFIRSGSLFSWRFPHFWITFIIAFMAYSNFAGFCGFMAEKAEVWQKFLGA